MANLDYKHIRFLGAEGIGMTALIRILEERYKQELNSSDFHISKSDLSYSQNEPLSEDIDLVVRSTAIAESDPDYISLKARELKIWHRSDMLNFLSVSYKQLVVSGTHGKTTCTAMLAHLLVAAKLDPCFAVGGILSNYNTNGRHGNGEYFVLEGDESDKSFMKTTPYLALVTCVEPDHLENYPNGFPEIQECFTKFLNSAQHSIVCIDDITLENYSQKNQVIAYSSLNKKADFFIDFLDGQAYIHHENKSYPLNIAMQGKHNYINACGVIAAAYALGISIETSVQALSDFRGIQRRFELINSNYHGIKVYDDYAHHPSEVKALLAGALSLNPRRLVFVYQPHHPERTKQLWKEFVQEFQNFPQEHLCLIADIYVARSKHIEGINSSRLVEEIARPQVRYLSPSTNIMTTSQGNYANIVDLLKPNIDAVLEDADYLFIVGAGDIAKVAKAFK